MKKTFFFLLLLAVPIYNLHAQTKTHHRRSAKRVRTSAKKNSVRYGTASFYAKKFAGRKTASGDRYKSTGYTAACNVFPLNTRIKVTNLKNKKSVIVVINDRMHAKNRRLVDLSRDAARELGYTGKGLAHVKVEALPK